MAGGLENQEQFVNPEMPDLGKAGAFGERIERLREEGFVPFRNPNAPQRRREFQRKERAMGAAYMAPQVKAATDYYLYSKRQEDWDYKTAERNMRGEPLPSGAVGWTPFGEPYYGGQDAITEWMRGIKNRFFADDQDASRIFSQGSDIAAESINQLTQGNIVDATKVGFAAWGQLFSGLGHVGTEDAEGPFGGLATLFRGGNRFIGEIFRGLGGFFEFGENVVQQFGFGTAETIRELAEESDIAPRKDPTILQEYLGELDKVSEALNLEEEHPRIENARNWLANMLRDFDPQQNVHDAFRAGQALTNPGVRDSWKDMWKENYQVARIHYTGWHDATRSEEFRRRLLDGENPYLLAQELQEPFAQLVGGLPFDMVNIVGPVSRIIGNRRWLENVRRAVSTVADSEVSRVLVKYGDEAMDITSRTAHKFAKELVPAVGRWLDKVETGQYKKFRDATLGALSTNGKRNQMMENINMFLVTLIRSTGDGDRVNVGRFAQAIDGLRMLKNPETRLRAISYLMDTGVPMNMLFSEWGGEAAVFFNKMFDQVSAKRFLQTVNKIEDPAELAEYLNGRVGNVLKEMIPSFSKRAENAAELAKKADKARSAGNLDEAARLSALAEKEKLTRWESFVGKVEATLPQYQKAMGLPFFSSLYMGYAPGYYARGSIQNAFQSIYDLGPAVLTDFAKGQAAADEFLDAVLGEGLLFKDRALGPIGSITEQARGRGPMLAKMEGNEARWGSAVAVRATKQVYASMTPKANIVGKQYLQSMGASDEAIEALSAAYINSYGNPQAVAELFIEGGESRSVRFVETGGFVDPQTRKVLDEYEMWEPIMDAVRGHARTDDVEGLMNSLDELMESYDDYGRKVATEAAILPEEDLVRTKEFNMAAANNEISQDMNRLVNQQQAANRVAENSTFAWRSEFLRIADARSPGVKMTLAESDEYKTLLDNSWWEGQRIAHTKWSDGLFKVFRDANQGSSQARLKRVWTELGLGEAPDKLSYSQLRSAFWDQAYYPKSREFWAATREQLWERTRNLFDDLSSAKLLVAEDYASSTNLLDRAMADLMNARTWDGALFGKDGIARRLTKAGQANYESLTDLLVRNDIRVVTQRGRTTTKFTKEVNEALGTKYQNLFEIPVKEAREVLQARLGDKFVDTARVAEASDEALVGGKVVNTTYMGVEPPSKHRVFWEARGNMRQVMGGIKDQLAARWGDRVDVLESGQDVLDGWVRTMQKPSAEIRATATRFAREMRDFVLLNYGEKRVVDMFLSYIFPYHFWYRGTYTNWMRRFIRDPHFLAGYLKYRRFLEREHSEQPEWWRYNINTNEILGLDKDNPLYFNIEATINPLNGITGVDFDDQRKVTGGFTNLLNEMNKFGPSTHTPFNWILAVALKMRGDEEAASRWAGRLSSHSQLVQALRAMAGPEDKLLFPELPADIDPIVYFFNENHMDPYLQNRVIAELAKMEQEGIITREQQIDLARVQEGENWELAIKRAINNRALGQTASFFAGVGFKGRTATEIEVENFWQDYFRFINMRDDLTPEEFADGFDNLSQKYPFADGLLIGRKGSIDRDVAFAYNVLSRVPPGHTEIYEWAGLNRDLVNEFYDTKGAIDEWSKLDRDNFMDAIALLGATLKLPEGATAEQWSVARSTSRKLNNYLEQNYGSDIHDKINVFFGLQREDDTKAADEYVAKYPEVEAALKFKTEFIMSRPQSLYSQYYGSYGQVLGYYIGLQNAEIERELGAEIWDLRDQLTSLPTALRDDFEREHPELEEYKDIVAKWSAVINEQLDSIGTQLSQNEIPFLVRDEEEELPTSAQPVLEGIEEQGFEAQQNQTMQQINSVALDLGGNAALKKINSYIEFGSMSMETFEFFQLVAEELGMTYDEFIRFLKSQRD